MTGGAGPLPLYQRFVNGVPVPSGRRACRLREKYLIFSVLLTFAVLWLGALFYLPELRSSSGESVYSVYRRMQKAGPELLLPPPHDGAAEAPPRHGDSPEVDPHLLDDRDRLRAKIDQDPSLKVLERPQLNVAPSSSTPQTPQRVPALLAAAERVSQNVYGAGGEDSDPNVRAKRDVVKEMMRHAWSNYKLYAWGKNELKPISKRAHLASLFGAGNLGATIVDGLDTLYLMGLKDEYQEGRDWVATQFHISDVDADLSVFETTIRFVGGLLSCFALTGDTVFRERAAEVADALLPAFDTPTGLPYALTNPSTKASRQYHWAGANSILSEVGTLHMEFTYLSAVTGNNVYKKKVDRIRKALKEADKPDGLYPNYINPRSGAWGQRHVSLGALGDSFYEYLLKAWLVSNRRDAEARDMFDIAMRAALDKMLRESPGGLKYLAEIKYGRVFEEKMDHLSCFTGGMFALAAHTLDNEMSARYMDVGKELTHTCHESYDRSTTKLGPEAFRFTHGLEARGQKSNEKTYLLRPETFESYFVLWRLTKDPKYREWGWQAVQALEQHCRKDGGYTGLVNVYHERPQGDDVQQSFFLAETLKYLYLLFSDDTLLPLDEWVFNTEAHPLPVAGVNPLYRAAPPAPLPDHHVADNPLDLQVIPQ